MRGTYQSQYQGDSDTSAVFELIQDDLISSPDQCAVVWNSAGEVVTASPQPDSAAGRLGIDIARIQPGLDLRTSINLRRTKDLGIGPISASTYFLTSTNEFSERTRILALDGEKLSINDDELLEWLINAEKQMLLGTDNHPVFETSLEETSCSIQRLPNGQISMTEVPRSHVEALSVRARALAGPGSPPSGRLRIETPLRCAARYFLSATSDGQKALRPGNASEVTAFIVITRSGFSFGLWSPQVGLFSEDAFLAPDEIKGNGRNGRHKDINAPGTNDLEGTERRDAYIRQAFDQLILQMSPDKLEHLQLLNYAQVVWATDRDLFDMTAAVAAKCAARTGVDFISLGIPLEDAVASGLLLGSYSHGENRESAAQILPPINLHYDIRAAADSGEVERYYEEQARLHNRKYRALMTVLAAPVITAACILAMFAGLVVSNLFTSWSETRADARTAELKPALERRKSYEANLKWYQEFISEVSQLRRRQPVGIRLLYQLNTNYPFDVDPSFLVSELKLAPSGVLEMKGFARNKDAVAAFLKTLEFAGDPESGSRLFSELAYEIQEAAPTPTPTAAQAKLPVMTGSTLSAAGGIAAGVVSWSIRGNYVPMVEFAPKPAAKQPPGSPDGPEQSPKNAAPPAAAAVPKPAA